MSDEIRPPAPAAASPATDPPSTAIGAALAGPKPNPSRTRLAMLMLIAVYPLITAILYVITPLTTGWTTWERTLLIAPLMVGSIVFIIAPQVQKRFGWFIARMPRPAK